MSDGMGREPAYLSSHATNRYFIPNWGMKCIKLKDKTYFLDKYLYPAMEDGYVEQLYPDNPKHPKQKYLLTEKEKALLR